jgi:flagellar basal body P-ring protein FlgI
MNDVINFPNQTDKILERAWYDLEEMVEDLTSLGIEPMEIVGLLETFKVSLITSNVEFEYEE